MKEAVKNAASAAASTAAPLTKPKISSKNLLRGREKFFEQPIAPLRDLPKNQERNSNRCGGNIKKTN